MCEFQFGLLLPLPESGCPIFCPVEHRRIVVEKFKVHFHQHPSTPLNDSEGTYLTTEEIHEGAVNDMYQYCRQNDLSQAWEYLWNRWYTPKQWALWACSVCDAVSRLKTTMIVKISGNT
jgi:hypothetical protein